MGVRFPIAAKVRGSAACQLARAPSHRLLSRHGSIDILSSVLAALQKDHVDDETKLELSSEVSEMLQKEERKRRVALNMQALKQLDTHRPGDAYVFQMLTGSRTSRKSADKGHFQAATGVQHTDFKMADIASLQFDVFALHARCDGRTLSTLVFWIMRTEGIIDTLHLDGMRLAKYFAQVEAGYTDTPYHNAIHAADVLQRTYAIMKTAGDDVFSMEDKLACYMAAAVHDYQHTGVTNAFLKASNHPLARVYNGKSCWEQHHVSASLELLQDPDANFMLHMSQQQAQSIRENVVELVLGTDMVKHFKCMAKFEAHAHALQAQEPPETRLLAMMLVLKAADIGHTTCAWDVHTEWVARLQEELHRQGELEQQLGLPVTPTAGKNASDKDRNDAQIGFYDVVVLPLMSMLATYFTGTQQMLQTAQAHRETYKS